MCALEIGQVGIDKGKVGPASVPVGESILTEETLRRLELPKEIQPQQVLAFLKQQSVKLTDIQYREPLKTASGDIPPPDAAFADMPDEIPISDQEFEALQLFTQSANQRGMGAQTTPGDSDGDITETMGSVVEYLRQKYGEVEVDAGTSDAEGGSLIDWYIMSEIGEEASELDLKWREIFEQLTKGGDARPEAIIMAMAEYFGEKYGTVLRKAIRSFADRVENHEKFVADLGLSEGKTLDATEMLQANMEQQANMMDSQSAIQMIQSVKQQIDKTQTLAKSELDAYHLGQKEMIRNVTAM